MMCSESCPTPEGTFKKWLRRSLSFFLSTASINAVSFSTLSSSVPKLMTSTATLSFLNFLPILVSSSLLVEIGLPTNAIMRCRWFFDCLNFSASLATFSEFTKSKLPLGWMRWVWLMILPNSAVSVTSTSGLFAIVISATVLSGFAAIFLPHTICSASRCASRRLG